MNENNSIEQWLQVTYLGGPTVILKIGGFRIITDPTLDPFPEAVLIPVHHEGWSHYTENGETLKEAFSILGVADKLKLLELGKLTNLPIY